MLRLTITLLYVVLTTDINPSNGKFLSIITSNKIKMRFGNCSSCSQYKYIPSDGKCPSCDDTGIRIRIDMISEELRDPETLRQIADATESVSKVQCEGYSDSKNEKQDDLDILVDHCRLYKAERRYDYADYEEENGSKLELAIRDALCDAKEIYF